MFVKLAGHYVEHVPGGVSIGSLSSTIALGNGTTVEMPLPFVPIGPSLAVVPTLMRAGDASVQVDFSRWSPARYGDRGLATFPRWYADQAVAVRICRAFDADPALSWTSPAEEITAWAIRWENENVHAR